LTENMSDTMQPRITVVTPTFNRAGLLRETIESILAQDYDAYRYVVIDDGSTDDTENLVRQFGHRVQYLYHENQGEAFTTSRGWALADTEYFAMVSSDDPMLSNWLSEAVEFMDANPTAIVGYPDWYIINERSLKTRIIQALDYSPEKLLGWLHCLPGPGAIIRKSALPLVTELRRGKYRYMPDMDSWMQLALVGEFKRIPKVLATWRQHPNSTSEAVRTKERAEQTIRMVDEFYARPDLPADIASFEKLAKSRALYIAAAILAPKQPISAIQYYRKSIKLVPQDPTTMPSDLKRKPLHSVKFVAREIFWRLRRRDIQRTQPPPEPNWKERTLRSVGASPLVSVIIPTYNRGDLLPRAIDSVLRQSYKNIELLVIDDGSTDGTLDVLKSYNDPRMKVVKGKHEGVSAARNLGISICQGDYVAFLDSDDEFHHLKIEASLLTFQDQPDASFAHSYWLEKNQISGTDSILKPYASGDARHSLAMFSPTSITTVVAPRSVIQAAGLFKPMNVCEDADYIMRLAAFGPVNLIEQAHTIVYLHGRGTPRDADLVRANQLRSINDLFADGDDQPGLLGRRHYTANIERLAATSYLRSMDGVRLFASVARWPRQLSQ